MEKVWEILRTLQTMERVTNDIKIDIAPVPSGGGVVLVLNANDVKKLIYVLEHSIA